MKQTFVKAALLVSACLMGAMSLPAHAEALEKYRVAITDLVLSPSLSASAAKTVSQSSLRSDMEAGVRNSRKFDVVSRNTATLNAIRAEQQFAKSGLAAGDAAQEGQLSNAQSLVQVEVQNFSFGRSAKKVPNIDNKYRVSDYASIELGVTIVQGYGGLQRQRQRLFTHGGGQLRRFRKPRHSQQGARPRRRIVCRSAHRHDLPHHGDSGQGQASLRQPRQ